MGEPKKEKKCDPCLLNAAGIMAIEICVADPDVKTDCKKLDHDFQTGKISAKDVIKKVMKDVKNPANKVNLKMLQKEIGG